MWVDFGAWISECVGVEVIGGEGRSGRELGKVLLRSCF